MFMVKSFVVKFNFHDVLGVCFKIRYEPYVGTLGPNLTVGPNIRLPPLKPHILFYSNGLAICHGLPYTGHVKVNNSKWVAILNLIKSKFFSVYPLLKPHILFHSNSLAI